MVQLTICQHWFRERLVAEQATSHCLNQWLHFFLMHVCVIRPQWVNAEASHSLEKEKKQTRVITKDVYTNPCYNIGFTESTTLKELFIFNVMVYLMIKFFDIVTMFFHKRTLLYLLNLLWNFVLFIWLICSHLYCTWLGSVKWKWMKRRNFCRHSKRVMWKRGYWWPLTAAFVFLTSIICVC